MDNPEKIKKSESAKESVLKSLLLILPMLLLSFLMLSGGQIQSAPSKIFALIMAFIFFNTLFFLMVHTGKTDKFRAIAFCLFALCLTCSFISHYIEARGSMGISERTLLACKLPFCHIVIPMTLIPMAFTRTIIFPGVIIGGYASIATMFVIWIGVSLALGRGFCSWGCFFGGWDDFFSRLTKKPLIKKISDKLHYLPYAILLLIVISSAVYLFPTYCAWLCPFKTVTEFQ
ncbi:MAG: 4Fe-4S binding protein, partial [Kiritimatiellaeota bacterium]|nr:4Fe-4S binding protein [Kiritimatiellota bacterium]